MKIRILSFTSFVLALSLLAISLYIGINFNSAHAQNLTCAEGACLMEISGRVLYGKNMDKKLPMASTTKVVTALTVIKNANLNDIVSIPKEAVGIEGSSIYLKVGEKISVADLLYGLMLQSGNDSATALALYVSGSVEEFAKLMTKTAKSLGANNSNFVNPHGLHNDLHYTTAYDLAKITCEGLKNENFKKIVSSKSQKIGIEENSRLILNKNKLLKNYEFANGVKTGFTKRAGRCFVGSAVKNGMQLIAVVLNCSPMFEESKNMLCYGFENYSLKTIISKDKVVGIKFFDKEPTYYYCPQEFKYPLRNGEHVEIKKVVNLPSKKGESGNISIYIAKQLIFSQKLSTI
ncbi:MAG: D-alanyl-D-alanine carboxypeptidase family protein [Clostridia bacterium]